LFAFASHLCLLQLRYQAGVQPHGVHNGYAASDKFWHWLRCLQRRTEIEAGRWGGDSPITLPMSSTVMRWCCQAFRGVGVHGLQVQIAQPSVALDKHVLLGLEAIQSTCACAHIIFASFTPLKSIHHLLHASTDLSSLLLLMCVPGTTRDAGWGCALYFPWVLGTPISHLRGLFQGRYTRAHAARIIRRYFPDSPRTSGAAFARCWKTG
jgi:hypothetical protein